MKTEGTYIPLVFAKQFHLDAVKEILYAGITHYGTPPFMDKKILLDEIRRIDVPGVTSLVYGEQFFRDDYHGDYPLLHRFLRESNRLNRALFEDGDPKEEWRDMLGMSSVVDTWRLHKQVYLFDPEFVSALSKTEKLKVYPSLLRRLPYSCFYLDFTGIEAFQPFDGMFVKVEVKEDDSILILGHRVMGQIFYTCRTLLGEKERDMDNGIVYYDYERSRLAFNKEIPLSDSCRQYSGIGDFVIRNDNFPDIWMFLMQTLTYLSSREPDIEENEKQKRIYRPSAGKIKDRYTEVRKWDIGVRYGNKVRLFQEMQKEENKDSEGTEKKQDAGNHIFRKPPRPHSRCAHWAHYWTGTGRKNLELRWIEPVFVGSKINAPVVKHKVIGKEEKNERKEP